MNQPDLAADTSGMQRTWLVLILIALVLSAVVAVYAMQVVDWLSPLSDLIG